MFHSIPQAVQAEMLRLEEIDTRDRQDGTPRMKRLRQIPPETGRFVSLLAATAPQGKLIEIGASAGYSGLWLSLTGRHLTTFEVLSAKIQLATETFSAAGVVDSIDLIHGDARDHLSTIDEIAFCFLDAEKEVYADCYEIAIPKLVPGGLLVADNALSHAEFLQPMIDRAHQDPRVDAVLVPIGKGVLVCRRVGSV